MTSIPSLLPIRAVSPSASSRSSSTPGLVVLIATATRAACRAPVAGKLGRTGSAGMGEGDETRTASSTGSAGGAELEAGATGSGGGVATCAGLDWAAPVDQPLTGGTTDNGGCEPV